MYFRIFSHLKENESHAISHLAAVFVTSCRRTLSRIVSARDGERGSLDLLATRRDGTTRRVPLFRLSNGILIKEICQIAPRGSVLARRARGLLDFSRRCVKRRVEVLVVMVMVVTARWTPAETCNYYSISVTALIL